MYNSTKQGQRRPKRTFSSGGNSSRRNKGRGGSQNRRGGRPSGNRPRQGSSNRGSSGRGRSANAGRGRGGSYIHPDKFINKTPAEHVEVVYEPKHSFADFGFEKRIADNVSKAGYTVPTRVQDEAIPLVLAGKDVIALANTGSGKTAAFVLPMIQAMSKNRAKMALVITPTRELAEQVNNEFRKFSTGMGIYSTLCVGGLNIRNQIRELKRGPQVVIGTPGRLKDLLNQKYLKLDQVNTLVLDEVDRMLDMGFIKDIEYLIERLHADRQTLCFSATITREIDALLGKMLKNPVKVSVRTSETGEHIEQDIIRVGSKEEKYHKLKEMLSEDRFEKVLIFGEMKHSVQRLANALSADGFPAEAIHGNKSQPQRQRALKAFREGKVNILVATDVAARGLDIPNVSHVINFDQPNSHEDYVHRIGRTGRAGSKGQAYTFI